MRRTVVTQLRASGACDGEGLALQGEAIRVEGVPATRAALRLASARRRPGAPQRLKLGDYLRARHVRVSVLGSRQDAVDRALSARRKAREIVLTLTHFSAVPQVVERSSLIATISRRLAQTQARRYEVALCEPPLALGKRATRMLWHERTHADPGARFFRELIGEALLRADRADQVR